MHNHGVASDCFSHVRVISYIPMKKPIRRNKNRNTPVLPKSRAIGRKTQSFRAPEWDLSDLYKGITDSDIDRDLKSSLAKAEQFSNTYKGFFSNPPIRPAALLPILKEYEAILESAVLPIVYGELIFSADTNPAHGAFLQKMKAQYIAINQHLIFFELELAKLSEKNLTELAAHPALSRYAHYLDVQRIWQPHRLTLLEEKLMSDKHLTGAGAFSRLFDEELSSKKFILKNKKVSEEVVLKTLHSHRRGERKAAAESLTHGLKEEARRLTYITNIMAEDLAVDDRYRKYTSPEESRHLANEISQDVVDVMSSVIAENYSVVQDFYHFKRSALKLPKLYDYDRYAPISKTSSKKIDFQAGKKIILDSYRHFSPEFSDIAKRFFDEGRIDADMREGKRGGAFCMFVTTKTYPYVFMNYRGTVDDVKTLAHELGHGVHACLMMKGTFLQYGAPLTICETASVFGELLVFKALLKDIKSRKEKFAFYISKIEDIFATVFRQHTMYKFEQDVHCLRRKKGELSTHEISALWKHRQSEMFGNSVTLTPGYDIWWSYIPHFIHTPFYVYAYAFGELLTLSLYAMYEKEGKSFVPKYMKFLSEGGSKSPAELLRPFGIDLHDRKFWQGGMDIIKTLVAEMKNLR